MDEKEQSPSFNFGVPNLMSSLKFSGKLNVLRQLKGMTIKEMSEKCGIKDKTMERYLYGDNAPSASALKRIERGLDINFDPTDFEERE